MLKNCIQYKSNKTFSVKGSRFKSKFRIQWNNDLAVKFPIEKKNQIKEGY